MNKREYLNLLAKELDSMPYRDVKDILDEIEAHFDVAVVDGKTEEQVAEGLGDPIKLAQEFKDGVKFPDIIKQKTAPVIDGAKRSVDPAGVVCVILLGLFVALPVAILIACILVCILIVLAVVFTVAVYTIIAAIFGSFGTFLPTGILFAVTLVLASIFLFAIVFLGTKYFIKGIKSYIKWNKKIWFNGVGV